MNTTQPHSVTVNTDETPATRPARFDALKAIAQMTDRELAGHHFENVRELIQDNLHHIYDYDDETSPFAFYDVEPLEKAITTAITSLNHVLAIAKESEANARKALPAPKAD